ncbi:MAG: type II 3-dehydroquinate dehydratase [Paracoccus sp. (in: a-proteobacteria)]|uniref:type II 3-dehydroquinate dehydratase n=1 Tax=Paracoccus sp. TaxID=267 RepID=UPI0026DF50CB|nr:type II 3-dehydroquinate dehydratase [Paracoccus sp. (in: a-proteobacteria)]MDO5631871.1 type II 3-dehydroquinate dehydratase [Paracoccus sp. (in: a-proteobacteria)]
MSKTILILNGPNLNRLGKRQPEIYGATTLPEVEDMCRDAASVLGLSAECFQTNHEGQMIDRIHAACDGGADGIIINPGAWTHTSVAVLDALNSFDGPVIEVHISNIHKREPFRHHSYVSGRADAVIAGCGVQGYQFAVARLAALLGPR